MNVEALKNCLLKENIEELGIPIILPSFGDDIHDLFQWALQGTPVEGRQLWFIVGNAKELLSQLPGELRGRVLPLEPGGLAHFFERGPYHALLLPTHGFAYSDPNLLLSTFWKERGSYQKQEEYQSEELQLWCWKSNRPLLKFFAIDHHHAVLWDVKKILRPLGIQVDFYWLSDGRQPVNEAIPIQIPHFRSSLDIYKTPLDKPFDEETKQFILKQNYDGILTAHSLVTTYRFQDVGLPMIHVNSTRFGNEWIQTPQKHEHLVASIQSLLRANRLTLVHNNQGDRKYFHQYCPTVLPHQEVVIPSLCENLLRLRWTAPTATKLFVWDTRQVLLQMGKSPFMKDFFTRAKKAFGDAIESQAILLAQTKRYLPEGYLDDYSAVVHIPYNISTMSMFEHVRANIPIWIPSKRLLLELWSSPDEPNELSWTMFAPGTEANASAMDNVRNPEVIKRWLDSADFYNPSVLPLCIEFDSIEEFIEKALMFDYQAFMDKAEKTQQQRRENITFAWEQVISNIRSKA